MAGDLIYICGPDGVGKSTQAELLIDYFKEQDKIFEYRWLRFHHLFSLPLLGIARLVGLSEVEFLEDGSSIGYHYFYKSQTLSFLYPYFLYVDLLIFTISKLYFPNIILKKNIVVDRFIYDTIVDVMVSTKKLKFYKSNLGKLYLKLIPKKTISLLLFAEESVLRNRRDNVLNDKTLNYKLQFYRELSKDFQINIIDSNKSIYKVQEKIIDDIGVKSGFKYFSHKTIKEL